MTLRIRGPVALGVHWSHDAAVSICTPDGIVFSLAEERIVRIKHYYGFPIQAIRVALEFCGLSGRDIDLFAFSAKKPMFTHHRRYAVVGMAGLHSTVAEPVEPSVSAPVIPPGLNMDGTPLDWQWRGFESRHPLQFVKELEELGFFHPRMKCYYVAHHRAHAASAFRFSGFDEACVLTLDGKGDGLSATISHGHPDGRLDLRRSSRRGASIGTFYQAVTEALGFVPVDGEFKTMGLAAAGRADGSPNPFAGLITVHDGVLQGDPGWEFRDYNAVHPDKAVDNPISSIRQAGDYERLLAVTSPEQVAHHAQALCEEVMLEFTRQALAITGQKRVAAAGGVMLNVKANAAIRDTLGLAPEDFFIFPDSPDSGLAAGAAMEALFHEGAVHTPVALGSPYLGHSYHDEEIRSVLEGSRDRCRVVDCGSQSAEVTAEKLASGIVIGTFQGRLEMGPRALGNRSVLADPRDISIKERINALLKGREWFVPFAPIVLDDDAHLYWHGSTDYRYMTFAVTATPYAHATVPAVVHIDGTMRPQVVTAAGNPWLHAVLRAFKQRTGVGVLVNTSFNRHGHPIVGSPADALLHLQNGWVDALILGAWFVERRDANSTP